VTRSATKARRDKGRRADKAVVLVYGEDRYDTTAIRELLEAVQPSLSGRVRALREPQVEMRAARLEDLPSRADRLARAVNVARAREEVACVFAHEDCDAVEPAHEQLTERIETSLSSLGVPAYAVTPAWELETWWFLWPEAVRATNPSWRAPTDYVGRNVGRVQNAKERLKAAVVPRGLNQRERARFRTYTVADSPRIARSVRERDEADSPQASSRSYECFRVRARLCSDHIKPASGAR
jgi:hypothetical protein